MIITKEIENTMKSETLVKPELKFDDYEFVWNEPSLGIKPEEEQEFRHLIKNAVSLLPDLLRQLRITENAISENKNLDSYLLGTNIFTPMIKLSHFSDHDDSALFFIEFASDGAFFVDREEDIWVPIKKGENAYTSTMFYVRWNLGYIRKKK
jgi:hypothetical protein